MAERLLGIDYGRKRIGVAVADELGISTRPLGFIPRKDDSSAAKTLIALARQEKAEALVIGRPVHANGDAGENVRWVEAFVRALRRFWDGPIHDVDERHSSQEAEEALKAEGRWPVPPGDVDAKAAAIILRRYCDGET
jgi:putative Holliday junction resolvase